MQIINLYKKKNRRVFEHAISLYSKANIYIYIYMGVRLGLGILKEVNLTPNKPLHTLGAIITSQV